MGSEVWRPGWGWGYDLMRKGLVSQAEGLVVGEAVGVMGSL